MRSQSGNLIYQNSLCLIYLKAVEDVLGKSDVDIENAINKGLYTEIKTKEPLSAKQVRAIERRMRELVDEDLPFVREELEKEMMVMAGLSSGRIDAVLMALRRSKSGRIDYKAVLTPTNSQWNSLTLYRELSREHAAMSGQETSEEER